MMSVEPSIGITSQQLSTVLWSANAGADDLSIAAQPASRQLKAELAYGFKSGDGQFIPYMDLRCRWRQQLWGWRALRPGQWTGSGPEGHPGQDTGSSENTILLKLQTAL